MGDSRLPEALHHRIALRQTGGLLGPRHGGGPAPDEVLRRSGDSLPFIVGPVVEAPGKADKIGGES